jgi:hypothetical protein
MIYFFNVGHTVTKVPDMRTYQNEFPAMSSIANYVVKLTTMHYTSTLFITSNLEKHNLIQQTFSLPKFSWPPIMPKSPGCMLLLQLMIQGEIFILSTSL